MLSSKLVPVPSLPNSTKHLNHKQHRPPMGGGLPGQGSRVVINSLWPCAACRKLHEAQRHHQLKSYLNEDLNGPRGFCGYEIPEAHGAGSTGFLPQATLEVCFFAPQAHWSSFQIQEVPWEQDEIQIMPNNMERIILVFLS